MNKHNDVIEIRNSRFKSTILFLACFLFVACSIWLLKIDPSNIWGSFVQNIKSHEKGWIFVINIIFFGAGSLIFVWRFFDRRVQLRITRKGLYSRVGRQKTASWADITGINVVKIRIPLSFGITICRLIHVPLREQSEPKEKRRFSFLPSNFKNISKDDMAILTELLEGSHKGLFSTLKEAHQQFSKPEIKH